MWMPTPDALREKMQPLPRRQQKPSSRGMAAIGDPPADCGQLLQRLCNDPSLRFTDSGRSLLRVLHLGLAAVRDCRQSVETVPPHCVHPVTELARGVAAGWLELAEALRERTEDPAQRREE